MRAARRFAEGWRSVARTESGAALVIALLTIVVMMLLTAALLTASMTETFSAQTAEDSARAFLVADAAAARALASLRLDPDWSDAEGAVGHCPDGALYDLLAGECMLNVAYPKYGSYVTSRPGTGDSGPTDEPKCAAAPILPPSASPVPLPPEEGFGTYTVTVEPTPRPEPGKVTLRAVGRVGRATRGFTFTVQRVTAADFVSYSALRVDATRVGNGTFRIHGSVYVRGNWEFHGNSWQLNDRPTSESERDSARYKNQTFVCSDLVLSGNPQIGEPSRPMMAVHVMGEVRGAGRAYEIHALLQDKVVPDIRLGPVDLAIQCVRGAANHDTCEGSENQLGAFPGLWDSYTNDLDPQGLVVFRPPSGAETTWQRDMTQTRDLTLGTRAWRIPKRGQADLCESASAALDQLLRVCAAYYDGAGKLYVAARQVIYIPGALSVNRDVDYRVEDNPTQACNPDAGEADPCEENDGSMFVVACEAGTPCDPAGTSPAYGFDVQEMLRAHRKASNGAFYPETTFPTRDLLAVLVNGRVRFGLRGNPSQQEINLVVLSGCAVTPPADPCDLTMQKNLQLYGSVISQLLVFQQNVDLFQVPDLRRYLPLVLDRFLNAPGGAAVVVTSWREIGF